jgi:hypothetical protein
LKVILDFHIWGAGVGDNAPLSFFTAVNVQNDWLDCLRLVVNRYKNDNTVIGLDLMNEPWAIIGKTISDRPRWETIAKNAINQIQLINPNLLIVVSGWGTSVEPMWTDISFIQQHQNIILADHIYSDKSEEFFNTRYSSFLNAGIPMYLAEIGYTPAQESYMQKQLDFFELLGLNYSLFVYGVNSWALEYDVVDINYNLNVIGQRYSNHIKSFIQEAEMATIINLTGITSGNAPTDPITVTAVAENPALFESIVVNYVSPQSAGTIALIPVVDAEGVSNVTVTVNNGKPINSVVELDFGVTVEKVNFPTIDVIADVVIYH